MDQSNLTTLYQEAGIELKLGKLYDTSAGTVWGTVVAGGESAIQVWEKLRELTDQTGYWPVLTGRLQLDGETFAQLQADEIELSPETVLEAAKVLDIKAWLAGRQDQLADFDEESDDGDEFSEEMEEIGFNPEYNPVERFATPYDVLSQEPLEHVYLSLIPTSECWQAAAYLLFGGWNACPMPEEQVAIHQYWHQFYGAEVVAMTQDIVEMKVSRPPIDEEGAFKLAQEQFLYCDDIVYQGVLTLDNLKKTVKGSSIWYFWWD